MLASMLQLISYVSLVCFIVYVPNCQEQLVMHLHVLDSICNSNNQLFKSINNKTVDALDRTSSFTFRNKVSCLGIFQDCEQRARARPIVIKSPCNHLGGIESKHCPILHLQWIGGVGTRVQD